MVGKTDQAPAPAADSSWGVLLIFNRAALLTTLVKVRQLLVIYGSAQGILELEGSSSQRRQPGRLTNAKHAAFAILRDSDATNGVDAADASVRRRLRRPRRPLGWFPGVSGRRTSQPPSSALRVSVSSHRVAARQRRGTSGCPGNQTATAVSSGPAG